MLYILLALLLISIAYFLFRNRLSQHNAKKVVGIGSLITALLIILRVGPLRLLGVLNLLIPFLLSIKNFRVQDHPKSDMKVVSDEMSEEEAYEILDLSRGASHDEIKSAYKKLIIKNHPDHGGSKYIANKLNQAKDLLLNKKVK